MTLGILKIVRHPDRVALEYALDAELAKTDPPSHHPQTFPPMGAATLPDDLRDDTCTWDNLRLALPPGATEGDCILLARALLERKVKEDEGAGSEREDEMMTLLNEGFK